MFREQVTIGEAINFLNELIERDRPAMAAMVANRVPCNEALANHPTVPVSAQNGGYHVGLLGILNGLFGVMGNEEEGFMGPIGFAFEDGDLQCVVRNTWPESGKE